MNIFLSGAAGLIGGSLAARLIENQHSVIGLVRSNPEIRDNEGGIVPTSGYDNHPPRPGEVVTIQGDISDTGLGLAPDLLSTIADSVDLVIHCAAITAFDADESTYQAVNVDGTANMINAFPDASFLHVSTAYVCGTKDGNIAEEPNDIRFAFTNGYEQSKAAAEHLVRSAAQPTAIARPSIVVGDSESGAVRDFDTFYAVFRLLAEGRISKIPACREATLDFVPVDHVIDSLHDIVENWPAAIGRIFHIASGSPVPVPMLVEAIDTFAQLDSPELVAPDSFDPQSLPAREQRLYRRAAALYASYFQRSPRFAVENLAELSGRRCPQVSVSMLRRMIQYCIDTGFLRSGRSEMVSG